MWQKWQEITDSKISIYISIGKFTITVTSNHQTPHSRAITGVRQFWCARSQYSFKPSASGKLSQSTTVPSHCERLSYPWAWCTLYFDWLPQLKSALCLFTLLSASKPRFEKRPVVGNLIKCSWTIHGGLLFILQSILRGWVIDAVLIKLLWNQKMKVTLSANIYWTMMIILHLICMCLIFPLSFFSRYFRIGDFLSFLSQFFEAVKELHKVPFPILI